MLATFKKPDRMMIARLVVAAIIAYVLLYFLMVIPVPLRIWNSRVEAKAAWRFDSENSTYNDDSPTGIGVFKPLIVLDMKLRPKYWDWRIGDKEPPWLKRWERKGE